MQPEPPIAARRPAALLLTIVVTAILGLLPACARDLAPISPSDSAEDTGSQNKPDLGSGFNDGDATVSTTTDTPQDLAPDATDGGPAPDLEEPIDRDGDTFHEGEDCDDNDPNTYPGAQEVCDGRDNDCDAIIDYPDVCTCPAERFGARTYLRCDEELVSRERAIEICQAWGYHLLEVNSEVESQWLTVQIEGWDNQYWLALSDAEDEGEFVWDSGAPATFTNWASGEPNDHAQEEGGEDCAVIRTNGTWNDVGCWNNYRFVCEVGP